MLWKYIMLESAAQVISIYKPVST